MRSRHFVLTAGLALLPCFGARAQGSDDAAVLRIAGVFLRDSLPKQPILIDVEMFRARPAISPSAADEVARRMGALRGRFADVLHCVPGAERKRCSSTQRVTILAFAQPVVQQDSA